MAAELYTPNGEREWTDTVTRGREGQQVKNPVVGF